MANTITGQYRAVAPWNDRPVVVLLEEDGHETYYHGVVVGPPGLPYPDALARLDEAFAAVAAAVEDWTYDDVIERMTLVGFEEVQAAVWVENRVD